MDTCVKTERAKRGITEYVYKKTDMLFVNGLVAKEFAGGFNTLFL